MCMVTCAAIYINVFQYKLTLKLMLMSAQMAIGQYLLLASYIE